MTTYADLVALLKANRSYRRFDSSRRINIQILSELVEVTRFCGSGRNLQPLRYRPVHEDAEIDAVFPLLKWAGYLKDWCGPEREERPVAYLVQCLDNSLASDCMCDDGIQIEAVTLAAVSKGLGCCVIKSFNGPRLCDVLSIPEVYSPLYVIALGYPVEKVVLEDMHDGEIKYYRDEAGVHHVPKRSLSELII